MRILALSVTGKRKGAIISLSLNIVISANLGGVEVAMQTRTLKCSGADL